MKSLDISRHDVWLHFLICQNLKCHNFFNFGAVENSTLSTSPTYGLQYKVSPKYTVPTLGIQYSVKSLGNESKLIEIHRVREMTTFALSRQHTKIVTKTNSHTSHSIFTFIRRCKAQFVDPIRGQNVTGLVR
jgi:hypothetical protein